jgi:hypothetical protein
MHINAQSLARGFAYGKKVLGDTWHQAVRIGQGMDHGMRVGKRLIGAIAPLLDQFGAGGAMKPLMQGVQAYDQGRDQAMNGYTQLMSHHARIKRQVPEIGL